MGAEAESSFGGTEVHTIWGAREAFKERIMQDHEYRKIGAGPQKGPMQTGVPEAKASIALC